MEQETSIAKLIPNRNGSVQYGSVSTHTLGPVHGGEGGGAGSDNFENFAC